MTSLGVHLNLPMRCMLDTNSLLMNKTRPSVNHLWLIIWTNQYKWKLRMRHENILGKHETSCALRENYSSIEMDERIIKRNLKGHEVPSRIVLLWPSPATFLLFNAPHRRRCKIIPTALAYVVYMAYEQFTQATLYTHNKALRIRTEGPDE